MIRIDFYEKGPTRYNRFLNNQQLISFLSGTIIHTATLDGCPITNTSSYFDFEANNITIADIYAVSYLRIINIGYTAQNSTFYCFVDRVEPNNFADKPYFRIYITIDWWSTLLGRFGDDFIPYIEGNVERAHVNDVERDYATFQWHMTTEYTTKEAECPINRMFALRNDRLTGSGTTHRRFLWILYAPDNNIESVEYTMIGDRIIPFQYKLLILPLFVTTLFLTYSQDTSKTVNTTIGSASISPSQIDDRKCVSMYVTDYCPHYLVNNTVDFTTSVDPTQLSSLPVVELSTVGGATAKAFYIPPYVETQLSAVNYENNNISTYKNRVVNKPTTYLEYLSSISKIYFRPYTHTLLYVDGTSTEIFTEYINSDILFSYAIDPSAGGRIVRFNYNLLSQYSYGLANNEYYAISSGNVFTPLSTNDEYTAISRQIVALQGVSNVIKGGGSIASKNVVDKALGVVDILGSTATAYNKYNMLSDMGEVGYSISNTNMASYVQPSMVVVYSPVQSDIDRIRRDLALYGYNTFLHPHEILLNHKRKYFNYLKMNSTKVISPIMTEECRLQIEEMFNNGVWLWHDSNYFGEFHVPNYPIIMDE